MAFPFAMNERREKRSGTAWQKAFSWFNTDKRTDFRQPTKMRGGGSLPGLKMEALEPRFLLSADPAPFLVNMDAPDGNDFSLRYDALTRSISVYDQETSSLITQKLVAEISYVRVRGTDFDDNLTLDFSDGFVSPVEISFEGGLGKDSVTITGAGMSHVNLRVNGADSGTLEVGDGTDAVTINLSGTEAVNDEAAALNKLYSDATGHGQNLRLSSSGATNSGIGAITSDTMIDYTFITPQDLLTVEAGDGDDVIAIDSIPLDLAGNVLLSGGAGSDAVTGPPSDTTWNITGANSGEVAGVSFVQVENLLGQADNEDTFVVSETGSLSGIMDGGAGGFDSLVLNGGSFERVDYVAFDLHSGTITRDGSTLNYAGLEPINDNMDVADRVIDLSAFSDTAEITQDGSGLHITPVAPIDSDLLDAVFQAAGNNLTFETINIGTLPSNSLTINLGASHDLPLDFDSPIPFLSRDEVSILGTVNLGTLDLTIEGQDNKDVVKIAGDLTVGNLTVNAEVIEVTGSITASGAVTLNALAEDDGVIVDGDSPSFLQGIGLEGFFVAATTATIDVSGSITSGGALTMTAEGAVNITTAPGDLAGAGVLDLTGVGVVPDVGITLTGATLNATSVSATSTADIDIAVTDNAGASDTSTTSADAAVSVVVIYGDSAVSVDGTSSISASAGAVTLGAVSELNVVTKADGSTDAGAKGATLAVSTIGINTATNIDSGATISATGGDVTVTSTLTSDVAIDAISTAEGSDSAGGGTGSTNQSEQRLADPNSDGNTSDQAAAQGGSVSFAGAVVVSDYRPTTSVDVSGNITTDQALTITAMSTDKVAAKADGTTTGSGATGVAIAVVLGIVDPTVSAVISGGSFDTGTGITMLAQMDSDETFSIEAVSGIGDGSKTSIAGSLAIHVVLGSVEARVGGTVDLNGSDLSVSALADTAAVTKALPGEDGVSGESTGIGASVALAIIDWQVLGAVDDNATFANTGALSLSATHNQTVETTAKSGASGATAVVPVAASSILLSDTSVEIGALGGAVSFAGDIGLTATHNAAALTVAEGASEGSNTAVGISFGLTVDEQTTFVRVLRDLASTGGAIALSANSLIRSRTDAKASAAGAGEDDGSSPDGVNETNSEQANFADRQTENRTGQAANSRSTETPDASGSGGGSMSVAAAIALTIQNVSTTTTPADGVSISADQGLTLAALSNVDALADADGTAAKGTSATVGAAASLTYSNVSTTATSGAGTMLSGDGITLNAGVKERDVPVTVSSGATVDTTENTIFLSGHSLETGDEVVYDNGGGTSINGLTDDDGTTKYYVVKGENGRIKLATDQNDLENTLVDLQSQGAGDEHTLTKTGEDAITFDPDKDVFALASDDMSTLRTGDAVTYSHDGGDTDIGGLTDGTTYFVVIDDEGLKLAESRDKAFKGDAIDLTSVGTGTTHKLTETESRAAADATSGASGGNLGIAGSLAINVAEVNTLAAHTAGSTAVLRDSTGGDGIVGALTITATADTMAGADADAQQTGGKTTGIGFSFGLNITDHNTDATYQTGAILDTTTGTPEDLTLAATGDYGMRTDVDGGAGSETATAVAPVVGISVAMNDTHATVESGVALTLGGTLSAMATHVADTVTVAKGAAETGGSSGAAVGISFGLTVAEDSVMTQLLRDATTGGSVTLVAQGAAASRTEADAGAKGTSGNSSGSESGGNQGSVDDTTQQQTTQAGSQAASRTQSGSTPGSASQGQSQGSTSTSQGSMTVAAAISLNIADLEVTSTIENGAQVDAEGAVEVTARGNFDAAAKASGEAATGGTAIGAAVALNVAFGDITATVGDAGVEANGLTVQALMFERDGDSTHTFSATSISGASGSSSLGIAGSFALNLPFINTTADISSDAAVTITGGGNVVVKAESTTDATAKAEAAQAKGGTGTGVGASVAIHVTDMVTRAELAGDAALNGANDLTVEAKGTHAMATETLGGADGGTAVTPVLTITVAQNRVEANMPVGGMLDIDGALTLNAELDGTTTSVAKGATTGTSTAFGASLALTVTFDRVLATLARSVTAGGAILVAATGRTTSRADAQASSVGGKPPSQGGGTGNNSAQTQTDSSVGEANSRTTQPNNTATSPGQNGSNQMRTDQGALTVAAAIGINIADTEVSAQILGDPVTPITVVAGGSVTVRGAANADAGADANGNAASKNKTTDDSIGAAVAVNVAHVDNIGLVDNVALSGNGISVEALMVARENEFEVSELPTVDTDGDTIHVGTPEMAFTTGEMVKYKNGGGTDIEGLTHDTDYYVITGDNGRIQLAASESDATAGKAITLGSQGAGDAHVLERTGADNITFDPDATRFEIELDNPGGLQTGEGMVFDAETTAPTGLTDGETYFVIVDEAGRLKLAETREDALAGEAIELTDAGTGKLTLTEKAHSTGATANSGATGGDVGVAGSAGLNFSFGNATASYGANAVLTGTGSGDSAVKAESGSYSLARALPNSDVTSKSTGVGLSFAINVADHNATATVDPGAQVINFTGLEVAATGTHAEVSRAKAGVKSSDNDSGTAVSGALALTVSLHNTDATIPASDNVLDLDGNLIVKAIHTLDVDARADADTKGGNTGVGIALALTWAEDDTSAVLMRDVSTAPDAEADDVTVSAESTISALTVSYGSSQGAKSQQQGGQSADQQSGGATTRASGASGSTLANPQPGSQVQSGNTTANNQTSNPGGQGGTGQQASQQTSGATVNVAAALAGTIVVSDVTATVGDISIDASGDMSVKALNDVDASTLATGLALNTDNGDTGVGAAVAVNVAVLSAQATIGMATITTGSLSVEAGTSDGESNEIQAIALAGAGVKQKTNQQQNQGGGGTNSNGGLAIAGAAGVNVYSSDTDATIADGASVTAETGNVDMAGRQSLSLQNIAGGGALLLSNSNGGGGSGSGSDGGTSVGAAVAVNILPEDSFSTNVAIGDNATVVAQGSVTLLADAEILPMEIIIPDVLPEALGIGEIETGLYVTGLAIGASIASGGGDQQGQGSDAGAGSAVINVFFTDTNASIGAGSTVTATTGDVSVRALSAAQVTDSAGSLGFSTSGAGVGIGLDVTVHIANTTAIIEGGAIGTPTTIQTGGNVVVEAEGSEDFFQLAVNVGAGDSTSGAGGLTVLVNITETQARVNSPLDAGTDGAMSITATGSVAVEALSKTTIDSYVGSGGGSLSGSAVGISVNVVVDLDDTLAIVGDDTKIIARGQGTAVEISNGVFDGNGDPEVDSVRGLAVTATSFDEIYQLAIAASASLGSDNSGSNQGGGGSSQSGGGDSTTIGIAGAVTVAVLDGETKAVLGDDVDVNADAAANDAQAHALQGIFVRGVDETIVGQDTGGGTFALNGDVGLTGSVAVIDSDQKVWGRALGNNTLRSLGGGVELKAVTKTDIDVLVIGIAGTVSTGSSQGGNGSSSILFAGAGAVTVNLVENEALAEVGANGTIATSGALVMNAEDNSSIVSDSGGVAFAVSAGNTQGETAGSIGASVAANIITQNIRATVTDSPISAASIDMDASNNAEIDTLTIAGAGSFSNSSTAFGGAGAGSGNFINATTLASISNSAGIGNVNATGGAVSVNALDNSRVNADAGSGAVAISTASSGSNAGAIAIGAAMAVNHITKTTTARINRGDVHSAALTVEALSTSDIDALTFGVSGSLSSGSGTLALSAAGSGSGNEINSDVTAEVTKSLVTATGLVRVNASEASTIDALTGSIAVSLNVGNGSGSKVGVGLGIAVTINKVNASAIARVDDTTISAAGQNVEITATNSASINSTAFGVALTVTSSQSGAAVGVSANVAVSNNDINLTTQALLTDSDTVVDQDEILDAADLILSATDSGDITANAVSAALSVSMSSGSTSVSGGLTVAASDNTITSTTEALVDSVDAALSGMVDMDAASTKSITAIVVAASVAVSVSGGSSASVALTGAGTRSYNETNNSVLAVIRNAEITATDDVTLDAVDSTEISATLVAVAASVSVGGGSGASASLTVAASDANNEVTNTTRAVIEGASDVESTDGNMHLAASSDGSISVDAIAASIGVTVGGGSVSLSGAGAGANAVNAISNTIEAGVIEESEATVDGDLEIFASDAATISATVITAAIAAGLGGSGAASITLSAAVSLASNTIENMVSAHVVNSTIDVDGSVDIQAESAKTIEALQLAVSVSVDVSSGSLSLAGAFGVAVTENVIGGSTTAGIFGAPLADVEGNLTIGALSDSSIQATLVAVTAAVSVGSGAVSLAMTASVSLATNTITSAVLAGIGNSTNVDVEGAVSVAATNSNEIDAVSVGVAISISAASSGVAVAAALALAKAENTISGSTDATIVNSTVTAGDAVALTLMDISQIYADTIAASVAISLSSGSVAGSLAVAVSLTENTITGSGRAAIDTANVTSEGGSVTLDATSGKSIEAVGVAAAISVAASGTLGLAGAGSGAEARNTITNDFAAEIVNSDLVRADSFVRAKVSDASTISATIVSVSAAIAVGGSASIAGAVAVTLTENTISGAMAARISDSYVDAQGGGVTVEATADNTIDSSAVAVGLSVAASGGFGAAGAGAGTSAVNTLTNSVEASIAADSDVDATGAVLVSARDSSQITADTSAASAGISGGSTAAVSVAIAVPIATNSISSTTLATIDDSDVDGSTVYVKSLRNGAINAIGAAVSVSISGSGYFSLAAAGAGAVATNVIGGGAEASVRSSNVTATGGGITVDADDTNSIDSTLVAAAVSIAASAGASISLSISVTLATNTLTGITLATIVDSDVDAAGLLKVDARNMNTIDSLAIAASVSVAAGYVGVAGAGAGAVSKNTMSNTVEASIINSTDVDADTGVDIDALDESVISSTTAAAALSVGAGAGAGAISVAVTLVEVEYDTAVQALIEGSDVETTAGNVDVKALASGSIDVEGYGIGVAIAGGAVAVSGAGTGVVTSVSANSLVEAAIRAGSNVRALNGGVLIDAQDETEIDVDALGVTLAVSGGSVGFAISATVIVAETEIDGTVRAQIDDSNVQASGGNVEVSAKSITSSDLEATGIAVSFSGGTVAGAVAVAAGVVHNQIGQNVEALIDGADQEDGQSVTASGAILVTAEDAVMMTSISRAISVSISIGTAALAVSVSAAVSTNTLNGTTIARAKDSRVDANGGEIRVKAISNSNLDTQPIAIAISAAVSFVSMAASGAGASGINTVTRLVSATVEEDAILTASSAVTVEAHDSLTANAEVGSVAVTAGLVGLAISVAIGKNLIATQVVAAIDDSQVTAEAGNVEVIADALHANGDIETVVRTISVAAAIGGAGAGGEAVSVLETDVTARVRSSALTAQGVGSLVKVDADSTDFATADIFGLGATPGIAVTALVGTGIVEGSTRALIDGNSSINANGTLDVAADSTAQALPDGAAIAVGGIAGAITIMDAQVNRVTEAYIGSQVTPGLTVDTRLDRITLPVQDIPFASGELVTYSSGGGQVIDGLVNGAQYYIIAGQNGRVQLAEASGGDEDFLARKVVDLTNTGTGANHSFTRAATAGVVGTDTDNDQISVATGGVPFQTGEKVVYNSTGAAIGGLTKGATYLVQAMDDGTIQLAKLAPTGAAVDTAGNRIYTGDAFTPFSTGERVTYDNNGNASIGGLVQGQEYFVVVGDDGYIQLADNLDGYVDTFANTIDVGLPATEFTTGEAITYVKGTGSLIGGLTSGQTYYVIDNGGGLVQLAATLLDAQNGDAIDLTSGGSGFGHQLQRTGEPNVSFDPAISLVNLTSTGGGAQHVLERQLHGAFAFDITLDLPEDVYLQAGNLVDVTGAGSGTQTLQRLAIPSVSFAPSTLAVDAGIAPDATTLNTNGYAVNVAAESTYIAKADSLAGGFGLLAGATVTKSAASVVGDTIAYVGEATTVIASELDVVATSHDFAYSLNEFYALAGGLTVNVTIADAIIDSRTEAFVGTRAGATPTANTTTTITLTDNANGDGTAFIDANGNQTAEARAEGIAASFGVSVNVLNPTADVSGVVRAYVGETTVLDADSLTVEANGDTMDATTSVTSGTISGFAAVSILQSLAKVTGEVEAFIGAQNADGSSLTAAPVITITPTGGDIGDGAVSVNAMSDMNALADSILITASFGVSVSAALPRAEVSGATRAYVRDGVTMSAATLDVSAGTSKANDVVYTATTNTILGTLAGIASVSYLKGEAIVDGEVAAYVGAPFYGPVTGGAGAINIGGAINVDAWSDMNATGGFGEDGFSGNLAGLVSISVFDSWTDVAGDTRAFVGQGGTLTGATLDVYAYGDYDALSNTLGVSVAGLVTVSDVTANANVTGTVDAHIGSASGVSPSLSNIGIVNIDGQVNVTAIGNMYAAPTVVSLGGALAVAISLIEQNATVSGTVRGYVGQGIDLDAGGLAILADAPFTDGGDNSSHDYGFGAYVAGASVAVSGLASVTDVTSNAMLDGTVEAFIGAGAAQGASVVTTDVNVGAGGITVVADSDMRAIANLLGVSVGGVVSLASYRPTAILEGTTSAFVRDGVNLNAGTLDISAGKLVPGGDKVVNRAEATSFSVNISLGIAASVLDAVAKSQGTVQAYIGTSDGVAAAGDPNAVITVTGGVDSLNVSALSDIDAVARTEGGAGSLAVTVGIYRPTSIAGGTTRAYAGDGADLRVSDLNLTANGDAKSDSKIFEFSAAGLAKVTGLSPTSLTSNNVEAYVGRSDDSTETSMINVNIMTVDGTGRGTVDAVATGSTEALAVTEGFGIAGVVGVSLTTAVADMQGKTRAYVGRYTNLTSGAVNLTASEAKAEANSSVKSTDFGIAATVQKLESRANASRITETFVGDYSVLDLGGANLTGLATTDTGASMANATIDALAGSLGVSVTDTTVIATVGQGTFLEGTPEEQTQSSRTRSYIGDHVTVANTGAVTLNATSDTTVSADVNSAQVAGLATISLTKITAKAAHDTEVFVDDFSTVDIDGALNMTAMGETTAAPQSKNTGIALGLTLGDAKVKTELASDTRAYIGKGGTTSASSITMLADADYTATAASLNTSIAGLATITKLDVDVVDDGTAEIRIGAEQGDVSPGTTIVTSTSGKIDLDADLTSNATAITGSKSFSLGGNFSGASTTATNNAEIIGRIGDGTAISAATTFNLQGKMLGKSDSSATSISGTGGVSFATSTTHSTFAGGVDITTGSGSIQAGQSATILGLLNHTGDAFLRYTDGWGAFGTAGATSFAGLAAIDNTVIDIDNNSTMNVVVGQSMNMTSNTGDILVGARHSNETFGAGTTGSFSLAIRASNITVNANTNGTTTLQYLGDVGDGSLAAADNLKLDAVALSAATSSMASGGGALFGVCYG